MRKKLFQRYVELDYYRLLAKQLQIQKQITRHERQIIERRIEQLEMELITPKPPKTHRQRTLTVVK